MPKPPEVKPKNFQTYIPTRNPKWKPHTNIGQAKNAIIQKISYSGSGGFYNGSSTVTEAMEVWVKVSSGEWELLWTIPKNTGYNDLPWKK